MISKSRLNGSAVAICNCVPRNEVKECFNATLSTAVWQIEHPYLVIVLQIKMPLAAVALRLHLEQHPLTVEQGRYAAYLFCWNILGYLCSSENVSLKPQWAELAVLTVTWPLLFTVLCLSDHQLASCGLDWTTSAQPVPNIPDWWAC